MSLGRPRSFEAPRQSRRQEPQESSSSRSPARADAKRGAGPVLQHPEDQAKGASPGRRSWGSGTAAERRHGRRRRTSTTAEAGTPPSCTSRSTEGTGSPPTNRVSDPARREARAHARGDRAGHEGPSTGPDEGSGGATPRRATAARRRETGVERERTRAAEKSSEAEGAGESRVSPAYGPEGAEEARSPSKAITWKRTHELRGEPGHRFRVAPISAIERRWASGKPGGSRARTSHQGAPVTNTARDAAAPRGVNVLRARGRL